MEPRTIFFVRLITQYPSAIANTDSSKKTIINNILTHVYLSPCKFSDTDYILIQIYPSTKSFYIVE